MYTNEATPVKPDIKNENKSRCYVPILRYLPLSRIEPWPLLDRARNTALSHRRKI